MTERKSTIDKAREAREALKAQEAADAKASQEKAAQEALRASGGPIWEVLTEDVTGHRTVHRVRALDRDEAVAKALDPAEDGELEVLDVAQAMFGRDGLGSNDITPEQMMARLKDGVQ